MVGIIGDNNNQACSPKGIGKNGIEIERRPGIETIAILTIVVDGLG
jgi:hypothetical protein